MPEYNQNIGSEVLPKGSYRFTVKEAKTHYSKQGNEMIELKLAVRNLTIIDRLVFTENAYWKIDQFRVAIGETLGAPGSTVEIEPEDLVDRSGIVSLDIEEYNGKEKNTVLEYCNPATTEIKEEQPAAANVKVAAASAKKARGLTLTEADPDNIPV